MTSGENVTPLRLEEVLAECDRHVEPLRTALTDIASLRPFTIESLGRRPKDVMRTLDQALYRFTKLQDAMGLRLIPAMLAAMQEPYEDLPMMDRLHRLEKLGYLEAESWQILRNIRNAVAHEYPADPAKNASILNSASDAADQAIALYQAWVRKIPASARASS